MSISDVLMRKKKDESKLLSFRKADIYIVSYPKCGRTWLRAIIGRYLSTRYNFPEEEMLNTETATKLCGLPVTSFTHDGSAMFDRLTSRQLGYDRSMYSNAKVILLGRDIRDTLVSAYFQATKRIEVFNGSISDFIRTDEFGMPKLLAFYQAWLKFRSVPRSFIFLTYEDLHATPFAVVRKVLEYMGEKEVDEAALGDAVEFCSFDNMQKIEKSAASGAGILRAKNADDPESFKVRKGKVGGYTEYLNEDDIRYIDELICQAGIDFSRFS